MLQTDNPRALIADDQPDVLEALRLLLKGEGFLTEAVTSPAAVLKALRESQFDLLLMDLNYARDTTSGREGLELLSQVRAMDSTLPVVVMTAWGSVDVAVEALREGVSDFVLKPWENAKLVEMLKRHITDGQQARSRERLSAERDHELDDARAIQRRLMPASLPEVKGYAIAAAWEPARSVGGDYYDAIAFSEDRIAFCIGDVSGKGMPAALLMSNVQAALRAYAHERISPAALCLKLNRVVSTSAGCDRFITFFYCVLNRQSGRLAYANAGHNPPFVIRADGSVSTLECGGLVLGPIEDASYEQCETRISSGDRVLMFTDGVTEARNPMGEEYGEARLIDLLVKSRRLGAEALRNRIIESIIDFSRGHLDDDVTLLVLAAE
jgi:sigma-B regulation protein RsbU (phosphoserine phosphatase)